MVLAPWGCSQPVSTPYCSCTTSPGQLSAGFTVEDLLSAAELLACAAPASCPQNTHGSISANLSGQGPLPEGPLPCTPMQLGL